MNRSERNPVVFQAAARRLQLHGRTCTRSPGSVSARGHWREVLALTQGRGDFSRFHDLFRSFLRDSIQSFRQDVQQLVNSLNGTELYFPRGILKKCDGHIGAPGLLRAGSDQKAPLSLVLPISQLLNMVDRGALAIRSDFRDLFNVQRIISKPRPNSEMEVVQSGLNLGDLLRELVRNTVQGLRQGGEFGKGAFRLRGHHRSPLSRAWFPFGTCSQPALLEYSWSRQRFNSCVRISRI